MRAKDAGDVARRRPYGYSSHANRGERDTGKLAARLAPPEERMTVGTGRNGAAPDGTIMVEDEGPKPIAELPDEDEREHGVFYMPPVVTVTVGLFLAYTIFVAVLIALG